jgi:penicillin V acylase-like amidase (Ntn superfamily)
MRGLIRLSKQVGADATADIVKRAASKFPGDMSPKDRFKRQELLLEVSPESDAFEQLDGGFYGYPNDLSELLAKYESK